MHYALNLPTNVAITGIDKPEILDQAFQAAKTFKPMNEQEFASLLMKTEQAAATGEYELFKVSAHFDGTAAILIGSETTTPPCKSLRRSPLGDRR